MRNFFCTVRVTEYWNKSPRGCRVSLLRDIKKLSGYCPGQLVRGDPALAGGLDQVASRGDVP